MNKETERGIVAEIAMLFEAKTGEVDAKAREMGAKAREMDAKMGEALARIGTIAAEIRASAEQDKKAAAQRDARQNARFDAIEADIRVGMEEIKKEGAQRETRLVMATILIAGVTATILGLFLKDDHAPMPQVVIHQAPAASQPAAPSVQTPPEPPQVSGVVAR